MFDNSNKSSKFSDKIVDVFVTSECIHLYILYIVFLCTPDVPIGRIINVIKSFKVIEVNPPC